jgi:DNA-binding LacI/PurR family transcriptional regulator
VKPATIYDVAKRAGVSHQTVTRFLRGAEGVRAETGRRVEEALRELDYRPNAAARLLRSRQTNRIGVLTDRIVPNGPVRIINAASETAHERGYVLDVVVTDGTSSGSVASSLAALIDHQVAGILAAANTEVVVEEIRRQDIRVPLVLSQDLNIRQHRSSTGEVAGRMAAQHLIELGHRRVGFLAGPDVWLASQDRARGFAAAFDEIGGEIAWLRNGDWTPTSGHDTWDALTASERAVSAVGVANDAMAIGLMAAAWESGRRLPEELSVIGMDDVPEARYLRPSLSTVALDFAQEGRELMRLLLDRIEGVERSEDAIAVEPHVVARLSTSRID